ncbi:MAG: hypothetical protein GWN55_10455, partial [Phycisphaerae bacterium]|nr:hypothetical protein [Phycisphaerae bacterium]
YINEEMAVWPDWYCCIAVALDAEEESWHNQQFLAYIGAGGDPKKFPKKKKRIIPESREEEEGPRPHDIVMGALSRSGVN